MIFTFLEPYTLGIELRSIHPLRFKSGLFSTLIDAAKPQLTAGEIKHDITQYVERYYGRRRDITQWRPNFLPLCSTLFYRRMLQTPPHWWRYAPFQKKWQRQEVCDNERHQRTLVPSAT